MKNQILEIAKRQYKEIISFFTLVASSIFTKELTFLHYNTTSGPDFDKYFVYLEQNSYLFEITGREQGIFYYYLNSLNFYRYNEVITADNFFYYLDKSIQELNFLLFVFSLIGFYFLLIHFGFKKRDVLIALTMLNFFPLAIAIRMVFKPEILALSFLPWIILCVELHKKNKKYSYLFLALPFTVALFAKGSVLGSFGLFFLLFYLLPILKGDKKKVFLIFICFVLFSSLISFEDYESNGSNLLQVVHDEKYNNQADINFIYKVDFPKLIKSPIKFDHADSFISLTLLDTFGDYFDLYWNEDSNLFRKHRKELFLFEESRSIGVPKLDISEKNITFYLQNNTDIYLRPFLSLVLSLLFFIFLFIYIKRRNKFSKFLFAPILGMSIMIIQSVFGFPSKNYDPLVGDSIKPYYYGYFLCLGFLFLCIQIFNERKKIKLILLPYVLLILFILGFPKLNSTEYESGIAQVNSYSSFCKLNKPIIQITSDNKDLLQCETKDRIFSLNYKEYENYDNFKRQPRVKIFNTIAGFFIILNSALIIAFSRKEGHF